MKKMSSNGTAIRALNHVKLLSCQFPNLGFQNTMSDAGSIRQIVTGQIAFCWKFLILEKLLNRKNMILHIVFKYLNDLA